MEQKTIMAIGQFYCSQKVEKDSLVEIDIYYLISWVIGEISNTVLCAKAATAESPAKATAKPLRLADIPTICVTKAQTLEIVARRFAYPRLRHHWRHPFNHNIQLIKSWIQLFKSFELMEVMWFIFSIMISIF